MVLFILSYGVSAQALRFPNSDLSYTVFTDIFYLPYFQLFGELYLEEVTGEKHNKLTSDAFILIVMFCYFSIACHLT